jgi:hypothetical protein
VIDLLKLGGYVLGVLITGRVVFLWSRKDKDTSDDDATYFGVVAGVLWPILLGVGMLLAPFIAIGWLISRPPRHERTEES